MTKHDQIMPVWTPALRFAVPGIPHSKHRPRFTKLSNGGVKTYTAPQTKQYETSVAWHARSASRNGLSIPAGVPVRVDILAHYPRPQRLRKAPPSILPKCVSTHGDLDNHIKSICDGLNHSGIWNDDGQVQCIRAEAVYVEKGGRPRSIVTVCVPVSFLNESTDKSRTDENAILATSAAGADTRTTNT